MRLRVIGVGSPHGDDAVGLAVAARLARAALPGSVEVVARSNPGLDLVEDLRDVDGVVLIDALRESGPPGAVRWVDCDRLARAQRGSSHAIGVAEALALASALGVRPARVRIVGIAVGAESKGAILSPAVRAAVATACREVRAELRALLRARPDRD